jgi:hypothetical protein
MNVIDEWSPRRCRRIARQLVADGLTQQTGPRMEQAVYGLTPIECRQVLIETVRLIASGVVQLQSPREHGAGSEPHRCERPECVTANRVWNTEYRRRRRAQAAS